MTGGSAPRLVIFDFDGTLAYVPIDWRSVRLASREFFRQRYQYSSDFRSLVVEAERIRAQCGSEAYRDYLHFLGRQEWEYRNEIRLNPRGKILWGMAASSDCRLAILSWNDSNLIRHFLRRSGMLSTCDIVAGRSETRFFKPDPRAIGDILRLTGASRRGALMIGNSRYDLECARRARVRYLSVRARLSHASKLFSGKQGFDHSPDTASR